MTFCPCCGYLLGEPYRCVSCGAFKLGAGWQRPDRLRVLTGRSTNAEGTDRAAS